MKVFKKDHHAEMFSAIITLQCWARCCRAYKRAALKRERRSGKLLNKLGSRYGGVINDDDSSIGHRSIESISTASITMLMGASAADLAVKMADEVDEVEINAEHERFQAEIAATASARPRSRQGHVARNRLRFSSN